MQYVEEWNWNRKKRCARVFFIPFHFETNFPGKSPILMSVFPKEKKQKAFRWIWLFLSLSFACQNQKKKDETNEIEREREKITWNNLHKVYDTPHFMWKFPTLKNKCVFELVDLMCIWCSKLSFATFFRPFLSSKWNIVYFLFVLQSPYA